MTTPPIVVERATAPTPEIAALVDALEAELASEYPPEQRHGLKLEAIFEPHVRFFVARKGGVAIGCGGVAFFEGYAELKRMFVLGAARGSGVADALLARIEDEARSMGARRVALETGVRQHAAIRFYERAGYRACGAFGQYLAMSAHAIATSVFMDKELA